jgi:hypothetical protein
MIHENDAAPMSAAAGLSLPCRTPQENLRRMRDYQADTLIAMQDTNARFSTLLTGDVEAMARVSRQFASRRASSSDIMWWTDPAPFDNNCV